MKKKLEGKVRKAQLFIFNMAFYFEVIAAIFVMLAIIITFLTVPEHLSELHRTGEFIVFLKYIFNIIIGIELLKMFCRHDLDSVVEVLLFAVARSIIIEHMTSIETLLGILAIAILFVVRKFLFVSALDKPEEEKQKEEASTN